MRSALLLASVLAASVLTGCGGNSGAEQAAPMVVADETPVRTPTPAIAGTSLDGEVVSLADFRGRPVLVNVWSSW